MQHTERSLRILAIIAIGLMAMFFVLAFIMASDGPVYESIIRFDQSAAKVVQVKGPLANLSLFITYLANPEIIILLEIVLLFFAFVIRRKLLAAFFVGGLLFGETLSSSFKLILARARPLSAFDLFSRTYSFPSSHAVVAMVFYGFMGYCLFYLVRKKQHRALVTIITMAIITLIGLSRAALGFHWVTDVVAGWLLGGAVLCVLIIAFRYLHAEVIWQRLEVPHGYKRAVLVGLAVVLSFALFTFYVTHPLKIRSTIESSFTV